MKKVFLGFFLLSVLLFSSCKSENTHTLTTVVWYIESMESSLADQTTPTIHTYTYERIKIDNNLTQIPLLVSEKITGDTLSKINYTYTPKTITCVRIATNGVEYRDSLKLNDILMASEQVLPDGTVLPYMTFHENGMRNEVDGVKLTNESTNAVPLYREATVGDKVIARYHYGVRRNYINLQQHTIFGSEYYWATDRFGLQSAYLLESATITENGVDAQYLFDYDFDANGFVTKERITRDDKLFMVNSYVIKGAVITSEPDIK